jgi:RNA polymerase sigma-70 factor, ECF subfamily
MDSDERLYERVRAGDLAAFDDLYARYEYPLFGFLRATLGNRADAEDAMHEAFLNTLKSRQVQFDRGGFRSWLYRIARNVALNRRRSEARGAAAKAKILAGDAPPTAHERLEARELEAALDGAVARLPPALAEVYRLRTSGLSYEEIADVIEAPLGTVKSRMHEMVRLLREDMGPWTARG